MTDSAEPAECLSEEETTKKTLFTAAILVLITYILAISAYAAVAEAEYTDPPSNMTADVVDKSWGEPADAVFTYTRSLGLDGKSITMFGAANASTTEESSSLRTQSSLHTAH